jgi:hypothetical protein
MPTSFFDRPPAPADKPAPVPQPELVIEMVTMRDHDSIPEPADGENFTPREASRAQSFVWEIWHYVGVKARATVTIPYGASFISTVIESPGIWGIESDSGPAYLAEVYEEEKATLRFMLESISQAVSQPVSGSEKSTPGSPSPLLDAPLEVLRHHVSGAIARGESEPIIGIDEGSPA